MTPLTQAMEYVKLGLRFGGALARHALDGLADVPPRVYADRLGVCEGCDYRTQEWTCSHPECGCRLHVKAKWRSESCPLEKWPGPGEAADAVQEGPAAGCGCGK